MRTKRVGLVALSVLALGVVSMAAEQKKAENVVKFSGDVEYRLRYHWTMSKVDADDNGTRTRDYSNQYAWNLKLGIVANENISFGVRLSNPSGSNTDKVMDNLTAVTTNFKVLSVPEMYFKWTANPMFALSAGIIQVLGSTVHDLVLFETANYVNVALMPWVVGTNNSQTGLNASLSLVNSEALSFGADVVYAIAKETGAANTAVMKLDQQRFFLKLPVGLMAKKVVLTPVGHFRSNVCRSADLSAANHSLAGGLDIDLKLIEMLSAKLGYAVGGFSNSCQEDDPGYAAIAPMGMLAIAAVSVKPGFGTAMVDFNYGMWTDREAATQVKNNQLYWDVKYVIPVLKLSVIPRLRIWHVTNDQTEKTSTAVRPEMILKGAF